jgi:hypothetical protein
MSKTLSSASYSHTQDRNFLIRQLPYSHRLPRNFFLQFVLTVDYSTIISMDHTVLAYLKLPH